MVYPKPKIQLWNTIEDISINVSVVLCQFNGSPMLLRGTKILKNIFCVLHTKESHKGNKGEEMIMEL